MNMKKRVEKIEAILKAKPGALLLEQPTSAASEPEQKAFETAITDALAIGLTVVVVRTDEGFPRIAGVTYVTNRFEGQLAVLAATPADGFESALAKALHAARNTSLPVVSEVAP